MAVLTQVPLYLAVGFIEMFVVSQRVYWTSKKQPTRASGVVFFETLICMFVFYQVIQGLENNILIVVAYAAGNSLGTWFTLKKCLN